MFFHASLLVLQCGLQYKRVQLATGALSHLPMNPAVEGIFGKSLPIFFRDSLYLPRVFSSEKKKGEEVRVELRMFT